MKRNTAFFSWLYNLSYTLFILLCINLCVSLHGLADSWRWILLGWGFAGLATKYLADQGAAGSGIYGHTLPLAPAYINERGDSVKPQPYLTVVLKNLANVLWILLLAEGYLTLRGLVSPNPVVLLSLAAGIALTWIILTVKRRKQ